MPLVQAAGVTLITHGHGGNVAEWVIPMCDRIPRYAGFPGTNVASYELSITRTGSVYYATPIFREGQPVVIEASTNFLSWLPLQTNTLGLPATWRFSDPSSGFLDHRFYRASLAR